MMKVTGTEMYQALAACPDYWMETVKDDEDDCIRYQFFTGDGDLIGTVVRNDGKDTFYLEKNHA